MTWHEPILVQELLFFLKSLPVGAPLVDATLGDGGHTEAILKARPDLRVLGLEQDPLMLDRARRRLANSPGQVEYCQGNFAEILPNLAKPAAAVIFDLGVASFHFDEAGRGFSFKRDEPLDMRLDPANPLTAAQIVNTWPGPAIEKILRAYGEERFAARIASAIKAHQGRIDTTGQLISIIAKASPRLKSRPRQRRHPATRVFQALRIAVNDELENLKRGLQAAVQQLEKGGVMVVISFHSLEDRLVKNYFKDQVKAGGLTILTKKPLTPSAREKQFNPRSRSAKLRAAKKI